MMNNPIGQINFKSFVGQVFARPTGDMICPVCSGKMYLASGKPKDGIQINHVCPKCDYTNKLL